MAVVRVGVAFSARVQRVALTACRRLFPLWALTLLNVHRRIHRKVGGTEQGTANCRISTNSGPVVFCGWIATARTHSLRAGSCEARTLPPAIATTCFSTARNARVCCCARSSLYALTTKWQALEGTHARRVRLSWKGNITCGCLVTAPFRRNQAVAGRFCRHAAAKSCMATWPSSVLATRSPPGSSASRLVPAVSSLHCVPGRC